MSRLLRLAVAGSLAVAAGVAHVRAASTPSAVRAGVVTTTVQESVLAMIGPSLAAGTALTIVTPGFPQAIRSARVVRELPDDGDDVTEHTAGPYYEITSADGKTPLPPFAIAVLDVLPARRIADAYSLHMSAALPDVRARWCASYEGIHFTLWAGEPLKAERIWHVYYSAGANLRPTCEAADTRDDGGF